VPIRQLLGVLFVRGVELGGLDEVHEGPGLVSTAPEVVGAARVVPRSALRLRFALGALHGRLSGALPALGRDEAALRRLPELRARGPVERAVGVGLAGARRI